MNIKKITALFLILILVGTFPVFAGGVSTYDILSEESDPFVVKLSEGGLPNARINEFLTEFDNQISTLQIPEKREYMEKYFLSFLFNMIMEDEAFIDVCVVFDSVFQEEFSFMLENNMAIPETFERLFVVSMGDLIKEKEDYIEEDPLPEYIEEELENSDKIKEEEPPPEKKKIFSDLEGYEWAEESINMLYEKKIMNGYGDGNFKPEGFLTRAEGTKIVCKSFLKSGYMVLESEYEDITKDKWYYKNVVNAEYFSLFSKMYVDNFCGDEYMTRQEFCTLAYRGYLKKYSVMTTKNPGIDFFDSGEISNYAYEAVVKLQKAGIIDGDGLGYFNPKSTITRAEAAKIINMLLEYN